MDLKKLTLLVSIVFLLTAFSVNVVSAKEVDVLVDYTEFNLTTDTQHKLNTTFTRLYMINITDTLTTDTGALTINASVMFHHTDNASEYINFLFNGTYFYVIGRSNNITTTLLDNSTYTSDVSVWLYETNASIYVDDTSVSNMTSFRVFDTNYFNVTGGASVASAGNVTVYVGSLSLGKQVSYQISLLIPIVIALAVVTMMVKMIEKMGKKIA